MTSMDQFHTRTRANEGIKLPLSLPDGTETEHFLTIRGVDSDVFREAEAEAKRNAMQVAVLEGDDQRKEAIADEKLNLVAVLVMGWSFDQECTLENIKAFLREAPQIADQIDQIAARRTLFFGKRLSNSPPSRKQNSGSTKPRKGQQ